MSGGAWNARRERPRVADATEATLTFRKIVHRGGKIPGSEVGHIRSLKKSLPEQDSLRTEVSYVIGILKNSRHREASEVFLSFLRSSEGQDAYAKFGFVKASDTELQLKAIP